MDYDTWAITLLVFRRTRLASFQLSRKDVASISSRVLRESFEKLGREQKEEFGEGVERKEGGACFKEIKVNFANVDKRRFSNKPNREISRGVLQNRGVCGLAFPLLPFPPLFFFFFFLLFSVIWYETVGIFGVHERITYVSGPPKRRLMQGQRKNHCCKGRYFMYGDVYCTAFT